MWLITAGPNVLAGFCCRELTGEGEREREREGEREGERERGEGRGERGEGSRTYQGATSKAKCNGNTCHNRESDRDGSL